MAETYQFSKDVAVYVDMSNTTTRDWRLVTCTSSKSLDISIDSVDMNNDCTGDFGNSMPSTVTWSFGIEGDANKTPAAGEISADDLFDIATNREKRDWRFESGDGSYIRYGEGFLSGYSESLNTPEYLSFTATLNGTGQLYRSVPT